MPEFQETDAFAALEKREWAKTDVAQSYARVFAKAADLVVPSLVEAVGAGPDPSSYGTHSLRRTKAAQIYPKTGNLRAVQLLLGHAKVDSTVRYLGVELEDALSIAEKIDI